MEYTFEDDELPIRFECLGDRLVLTRLVPTV